MAKNRVEIRPRGKRQNRHRNDHHNFKAEKLTDIKFDPNLQEMHFNFEASANNPASVFNVFIDDLVKKMESKRRYGYIRMFINTGDPKPFSILIRCFNAYVNGLHNGTELYEIGPLYEEARYFIGCKFTGYGEAYHELLGIRGIDNLLGLTLGPITLRQDAQTVLSSLESPKSWMEPIARFALTFNESARFVWIKQDINEAFVNGVDITIDGKYLYIIVLTRKWGDICKVARKKNDNDTVESDPCMCKQGDRDLIPLLTKKACAIVALGFKTQAFGNQDYDDDDKRDTDRDREPDKVIDHHCGRDERDCGRDRDPEGRDRDRRDGDCGGRRSHSRSRSRSTDRKARDPCYDRRVRGREHYDGKEEKDNGRDRDQEGRDHDRRDKDRGGTSRHSRRSRDRKERELDYDAEDRRDRDRGKKIDRDKDRDCSKDERDYRWSRDREGRDRDRSGRDCGGTSDSRSRRSRDRKEYEAEAWKEQNEDRRQRHGRNRSFSPRRGGADEEKHKRKRQKKRDRGL